MWRTYIRCISNCKIFSIYDTKGINACFTQNVTCVKWKWTMKVKWKGHTYHDYCVAMSHFSPLWGIDAEDWMKNSRQMWPPFTMYAMLSVVPKVNQLSCFINGMNDKAITAKIIKEFRALKDISEVSSEHILVWAQRVEVQRAHKAVLDNIRDAKDFDSTSRDTQKPGQSRQQKEDVKEKKLIENCTYCVMVICHLDRILCTQPCLSLIIFVSVAETSEVNFRCYFDIQMNTICHTFEVKLCLTPQNSN